MRNRSVVVWMLLLDAGPGEQAIVQNNCTDNVFKRKQAKNTTRLKLLLLYFWSRRARNRQETDKLRQTVYVYNTSETLLNPELRSTFRRIVDRK